MLEGEMPGDSGDDRHVPVSVGCEYGSDPGHAGSEFPQVSMARSVSAPVFRHL